jgi:hypothetical protein
VELDVERSEGKTKNDGERSISLWEPGRGVSFRDGGARGESRFSVF